MIITKIIIYSLMATLIITGCANAISISNANFEDIEQGKSYTQNVTLLNSQNDFDNHFTIEVDGSIKPWIKATPSEFDLKKDEIKQITLTLGVPEDADLGEIRGIITATGKNTMSSSDAGEGGTNVGYAVATKSNIYANVIKPGAVSSIEITGVEAPSVIPVGIVAKFTVTAKNTGNVPASASFKLDIKKDDRLVSSVTGTNAEFSLGKENTVKLFWDTQGISEGKYEAHVEASTIARGSEKITSTSYKPITVIIGSEKDISTSAGEKQGKGAGDIITLIVASAIVIMAIIIMVVLSRKK